MIRLKQTLVGLAAIVAGSVWATPGAVDKYNCHRDNAGNYHCHGDQAQSQLEHITLGIANTTDVWYYDDGPPNIFTGGTASFEYGKNSVTGYASYTYQVHIAGNIKYRLSGWGLGLKVGPNIARLGFHPYAVVGFHGKKFSTPSDNFVSYGGIEYGTGLVWNASNMGIDARILYRDPNALKEVWANWGIGGLTLNLASQIGFYARF